MNGLARETQKEKSPADQQIQAPRSDKLSMDGSLEKQHVSAVADTFLLALYTFDQGGICKTEAWTTHDVSAQTGCYFHIDDFAGLGGGSKGCLVAPEGQQAAWCGGRPGPATADLVLCSYAALPGYGNNWSQNWVSRCFEINPNQEVTISYSISWDSEPGYDYTYVQYVTKSTCDSLNDLDNIMESEWITTNQYTGYGCDSRAVGIIPAGHGAVLRFRFNFQSDDAWSDEDGWWDTDGAAIIDLMIIDGYYFPNEFIYDIEDFEDEISGALVTNDGDWECHVQSGYGDYAALYPGVSQNQEDPCTMNLSCFWAFVDGTGDVPYCNNRNQCIKNEIWSPAIPWTGAGYYANLEFDVYEDLVASDCVFYVWHVRSIDADGCPGEWRDRNQFYYGSNPPIKAWRTVTEPIADLINPIATHIQVALGVWDMCSVWGAPTCRPACNTPGATGHTNSPMFDNVKVYRVHFEKPTWSVNSIHLFQDTFPENGTLLGTGRVDMALDINASLTPPIVPGDSAVVECEDVINGLREPEPYTGFGSAVYFYLSRDPQTKSMPLDMIVEDSFRWPVVDSVMCNGRLWYQYRMDTCFTDNFGPRTGPVQDRWCIDLNDHYFTNGDTLCFFFGAENEGNKWSWWSEFTGTVESITMACVEPMEMQILPGKGYANHGDILYVDRFDGYGAQPYFDSSFEMMNIDDRVDRYDVRDPFQHADNGLASRAAAGQIISAYRKIIWNTGDLLTGTIGDGTGVPCKEPDDQLLFVFLDQHPVAVGCGIYFSGDNIAQEGIVAPLIDYNLGSGDHTAPPFNHPIVPYGIGTVGGIFDHPPFFSDTLVVYGGCPEINDFDVVEPILSSSLEMTYDGELDNPAVISQSKINSMLNSRRVVLSGFSFHYIRDDRPAGVPDRADYLKDIITYLQNIVDYPVDVGDHFQYVNALYQNHPNPFNPSTSIKYSIRERAHVSLKIYNVAGQLIRTLVNEEKNSGVYVKSWDSRNNAGEPVSSGVYFYRLVTKEFTKTKKMVLIR
jgi:hypothetical protein